MLDETTNKIKCRRLCHAERRKAFQCECQREPEKQLKAKF
jgi:hypothetical protein